jgi:monoamine oxidase
VPRFTGETLVARSLKPRDNHQPAMQVARTELNHSIQKRHKRDQAVEHFQRAVTNETINLRLGTSTVMDHTTIDDRFSATLQARIAVLACYASTLVRGRYATGLLLPADTICELSLSHEGLLTRPELNGAPGIRPTN